MLQRLVDTLSGQSLHAGYAVVFGLLVLCGFGLPMPEDIILVTGGVLAWIASPLDEVSFAAMVRDEGLLTMVAMGLAGILAGDSIIYFIGRRLGVHVAEHRFLRRIVTPQKLERVETLLRRRGKIVVVVARYLPGLRAPTYFTVGHSRLPYWEFLLFDAIAATVSAPLWVCLGFWFGEDVHRAAREASRFGHYLLLALAVVGGFFLVRWLQRRSAARNASARTL
ncbi:MAG TPA: DedA family protein [Anaeromyxobacteraceae bacterium]|nr:DedA family protein [Anaeromyxobacteraceae bacterium]